MNPFNEVATIVERSASYGEKDSIGQHKVGLSSFPTRRLLAWYHELHGLPLGNEAISQAEAKNGVGFPEDLRKFVQQK